MENQAEVAKDAIQWIDLEVMKLDKEILNLQNQRLELVTRRFAWMGILLNGAEKDVPSTSKG